MHFFDLKFYFQGFIETDETDVLIAKSDSDELIFDHESDPDFIIDEASEKENENANESGAGKDLSSAKHGVFLKLL